MYTKNVRYESDYYLIERNPMTIVVGAKFSNGVIIASDSQATDENSNVKDLEAIKLYSQSINERYNIIMAIAGKPHYAKLALEFILGECRGILGQPQKQNMSSGEFKSICENSVNRIVRQYVINKAVNQGLVGASKINFKEWQDEISLLQLRFLIGIIINKEPFLYHLTPNGEAIEIGNNPEPIGSGHSLARYIIKKIEQGAKLTDEGKKFNEWSEKEILFSLFYVIDQVKKYDKNCGGEIQYIVLRTDNKIEKHKDTNLIEDFESINLNKIEEKYKYIWEEIGKEYKKEDDK